MTTLLEQREKILTRHKTLESVEGSAWHPKHPAMRASMENDGHMLLTERPITFKCYDPDTEKEEIVAVGPCVAKIIDGLKKFAAKLDTHPSLRASAKGDAQLSQTIERVTAIITKPQAPEFRVSTSVWNSVTHALGIIGIQCVLTDGTYHDEPRGDQVANV